MNLETRIEDFHAHGVGAERVSRRALLFSAISLLGELAILGNRAESGPETTPPDLQHPTQIDLPSWRCAQYARLAQKRYFGAEYRVAPDAWHYAEANRSVWKADRDVKVREALAKYGFTPDTFYSKGITAKTPGVREIVGVILEQMKPHLVPGAMIGIFNPASNHNGKGIPYTHAAAYVGKKDEKQYLHHQYGSRIEALTFDMLVARNLIPREIIMPR